MYGVIAGEQVTKRKIECAPPWLIDRAIDEEVNTKWEGSHECVKESEVSRREKVIDSHFVYKVKIEEAGKK